VNSHFGLAKIYQRQGKVAQALVELDAAVQLDPARTDIHYVRGQVLLHTGRKVEAKKELEMAVSIDNDKRAAREKQMETVPSPELLQDPQ
jgi:Tfp pilus assembly protein PilF